MALWKLPLVLVISQIAVLVANADNGSQNPIKLNTKKRNDLVDEAFLEQKDVLLDMLETKLKEVRDKKKKKSEHSDIFTNVDAVKCENLLKNIDLKLKSNGISAVGEVDVNLKFGRIGNGSLTLDATGISNVGKAHLDLGVGDGNIYIPGLSNLFNGRLTNLCKSLTETENLGREVNDTTTVEARRSENGTIVANNSTEAPSLAQTNTTTVNVGNDTTNTNNVTHVVEAGNVSTVTLPIVDPVKSSVTP